MSRLRTTILLTVAALLLAAAPASALVHPTRSSRRTATGSRPAPADVHGARHREEGPLQQPLLLLTRHKRVGKCGKLKNPLDGKGEFRRMRRQRHHRFLFSGRAGNFSFPGFWRVTPGTYYWQASRIDSHARCGEAYSKIYKLRVR